MSARELIVDDEEAIRQVITAMLSAVGYERADAVDGEAAVAILVWGEELGGVSGGLMMARVDGAMPLETIKKRYPELPVVIASTVRDEFVIKAVRDSGAYAYLMEPFTREELQGTVREAL